MRLNIVNQNQTCLTNNQTLPVLTGEAEKVIWTCDISGSQLHFEIRAQDDTGNSFPAALPHKVGTADRAELAITSIDGAPRPMGPGIPGKQPLKYGAQPPSFAHQPLYRVLENSGMLENKDFQGGSAGGSLKYDFRVLYTKVIILHGSTVPSSPGAEGAEIGSEEEVWWCEWEKTFIEGRVWMEAVNGTSRKVDPVFRMTLHESRLSNQELQKLFLGSKGAITCLKKVNKDGDLVGISAGNVGTGGNTSSGISKAKVPSEARAVEEVVRRRFGRGSILRRDSLSLQLNERVDGEGQCLCEWEGRNV